MKKLYTLETAAIFFLANLFLKQGISSEYVMVDFICSDCKERNQELQNEKSIAHSGTRTHDP